MCRPFAAQEGLYLYNDLSGNDQCGCTHYHIRSVPCSSKRAKGFQLTDPKHMVVPFNEFIDDRPDSTSGVKLSALTPKDGRLLDFSLTPDSIRQPICHSHPRYTFLSSCLRIYCPSMNIVILDIHSLFLHLQKTVHLWRIVVTRSKGGRTSLPE